MLVDELSGDRGVGGASCEDVVDIDVAGGVGAVMGIGVEGGGVGSWIADISVVDAVVSLGLVIELYGVVVIDGFIFLDSADAVQAISEDVDFIGVGGAGVNSDVSGGVEVEDVAVFVSEEICQSEVGQICVVFSYGDEHNFRRPDSNLAVWKDQVQVVLTRGRDSSCRFFNCLGRSASQNIARHEAGVGESAVEDPRFEFPWFLGGVGAGQDEAHLDDVPYRQGAQVI